MTVYCSYSISQYLSQLCRQSFGSSIENTANNPRRLPYQRNSLSVPDGAPLRRLCCADDAVNTRLIETRVRCCRTERQAANKRDHRPP